VKLHPLLALSTLLGALLASGCGPGVNTPTWTVVSLPGTPSGVSLSSAACAPDGACLTGGEDSSGLPRVYRWNGTTWNSFPAPPAPGAVTSLTCPVSNVCWAILSVGGPHAASASSVAVLKGTHWSVLTGDSRPLNAAITTDAIGCINASRCLVISGDVVWTVDGSTWSQSSLPIPAQAISCAGGTCVVVGSNSTAAELENGRWVTLHVAAPSTDLNSVSCWAALRCEAVGDRGRALLVVAVGAGAATATSVSVPRGNPLGDSVSCLARGGCRIASWVQVGKGGTYGNRPNALIGGPAKWWLSPTTEVPPDQGLVYNDAMACGSATFCLVVGTTTRSTPGGSSAEYPFALEARLPSAAPTG
jgi:hypothetical protein